MLHEVTDFAMVVLSHIVMSLLSYCSSSDIKKRGIVLLSIPPTEALALPIKVEQTTSEPTPI